MSAAVLAPVLGPAAASVGLQVLLQPYGAASTLGKVANTCVGLLYPAYCTLKAVEQRQPNTATSNKWLIYWSVYGLLTAAEKPLDKVLAWVPYYQLAKLVLLLWLQSPAYEGAQRIYIEGIRPWLLRYQPALDHGLAALLHALRRPELAVLAEVLHHFAQRTPVLEWFVRGPAGGPAPRAFITDGSHAPRA
ncbi:hypothetical protein COHA_005531 [Chlorella ohadii]|uniref:HVA22-like protein n=1 Tax=Chlorella ohadii TaxID=2649997 RepID=A0AAD5DMU7_9CHLO|nr:hypothetical protein COHA_005531 [Chlorella ohadii]